MDVILENLEIRHDTFSLHANFTVNNGTTAIIGPSGGGKSSLVLAIAGFDKPAQGRVLFDQMDLSNVAPAQRPVTLLFQENNLFPHLNVFQNTALGLRPNLKLTSAETDRVENALSRVGLSNTGTRLPAALSGGQRQRVALARALLRNKPVLMLDEPFAALGPALRHEMLDLVAEIRAAQNATLLLVTHNPDDARRIAENTILVAGGQAIAPSPTKNLLDNPPPALHAYLGT
ncbi:MAG: ATP-binding cassette domain-containing protein [Paracoccaceae bacterium]